MNLASLAGWWLLPAAVTIASLLWAIPMRTDERPTGSMFDGLGYPVGVMIRLLVAGNASIASWFIWAWLT